ncbi:hypothetical protein DFH07DRAFT_779842 [Mycena maculata]|uniref:Uncharacterized protein n=1 Tax=Mycena maculata TaxID=230809 RepID=A0AAD7I6C8_9AGAR|nr:hypothetical protein DFH07DRAFT_779842 [Mycena maculata]
MPGFSGRTTSGLLDLHLRWITGDPASEALHDRALHKPAQKDEVDEPIDEDVLSDCEYDAFTVPAVSPLLPLQLVLLPVSAIVIGAAILMCPTCLPAIAFPASPSPTRATSPAASPPASPSPPRPLVGIAYAAPPLDARLAVGAAGQFLRAWGDFPGKGCARGAGRGGATDAISGADAQYEFADGDALRQEGGRYFVVRAPREERRAEILAAGGAGEEYELGDKDAERKNEVKKDTSQLDDDLRAGQEEAAHIIKHARDLWEYLKEVSPAALQKPGGESAVNQGSHSRNEDLLLPGASTPVVYRLMSVLDTTKSADLGRRFKSHAGIEDDLSRIFARVSQRWSDAVVSENTRWCRTLWKRRRYMVKRLGRVDDGPFCAISVLRPPQEGSLLSLQDFGSRKLESYDEIRSHFARERHGIGTVIQRPGHSA